MPLAMLPVQENLHSPFILIKLDLNQQCYILLFTNHKFGESEQAAW